MSRYFTRHKASTVHTPGRDWHEAFDQDFGRPSCVTSFEVDDFEPTDTGLLDHLGDCVMRAPNPIDFGRDEEW